jgi:hypothetical protein
MAAAKSDEDINSANSDPFHKDQSGFPQLEILLMPKDVPGRVRQCSEHYNRELRQTEEKK